MTLRTYEQIDGKGRKALWEWEESKDTVLALKQFHALHKSNEAKRAKNS
jgi:hypothetical protein